MSLLGIVSGFVENEKGEVLYVREINPKRSGDSYKTPTGHIELGESPEQAFIREIKEETGGMVRGRGYNIEIISELTTFYHPGKEQDVTLERHVFYAHIISGEPKVPNNEISEIRWMTREYVPSEMNRCLFSDRGEEHPIYKQDYAFLDKLTQPQI
jgi:8-oxo-dGTP pyrophosphatase MutT (NUDIX family)